MLKGKKGSFLNSNEHLELLVDEKLASLFGLLSQDAFDFFLQFVGNEIGVPDVMVPEKNMGSTLVVVLPLNSFLLNSVI